MSDIKVCSRCKVPTAFSKPHSWNKNGTITQVKKTKHPLLFYEVEWLKTLFGNIEKMLGISIEHIVTEGKRQSTYAYMHGLFPGFKRTLLRNFLPNAAYKETVKLARIFGLGDFEYLGCVKGEYVSLMCRNTYYLPFAAGDLMAIFGYLEEVPTGLDLQPGPDGAVKITANKSLAIEKILEARLSYSYPEFKPGDLNLEKCPECGVPVLVGDYEWNLEAGTIIHRVNGRRMALIGPSEIYAIFKELEKEIGSEIEETVVNAQRECLKEALDPNVMARDETSVRQQLAVRGFGNMVLFDMTDEFFRAKVENTLVPELVAGYLLALFEILSGSSAEYKYEYHPDATIEFSAGAK